MRSCFLLWLADAATDPVVAEFSAQDGSLSVAGRDFLKLPKGLGARFGADTHLLDASYNLLSYVRFSVSLPLARFATFAVAFVLTLALPLRRSLDEVEHFVKLDSLILDNNELTDSAVFPSLPGLKTLSLNNNQLQDLDKFLTQATASFNNLEFLSMLKNPACPHPLGGGDPEEYKRFRCALSRGAARGALCTYHLCIRMRVIYRLGSLKFLDSQPVTAAEKREASRIGQFLRVVKPVEVRFFLLNTVLVFGFSVLYMGYAVLFIGFDMFWSLFFFFIRFWLPFALCSLCFVAGRRRVQCPVREGDAD